MDRGSFCEPGARPLLLLRKRPGLRWVHRVVRVCVKFDLQVLAIEIDDLLVVPCPINDDHRCGPRCWIAKIRSTAWCASIGASLRADRNRCVVAGRQLAVKEPAKITK